jgi:ubiquinone/menaquinone biosynthesis C-methylase UbiE
MDETQRESSKNPGARDFFDGLAGGWAARYSNDPAMAERLQRFAKALASRIVRGATLLDYGCGAGVIASHLAGLGYRLTGCDISAEMIASASAHASSPEIRWDVCDGPLPYEAEEFDAIISSSVLEYVIDLEGTIREFRRVLRPGGWLLITVPDVRDVQRRREAFKRWVLAIPLLGPLMESTRWAEGARYLRLSRNRMPPEEWVRFLAAGGFAAESVPCCEGPLLLLAAQRVSTV